KSSPFELELEKEPRRFWLDRGHVVFATIHDDSKDAQRSRYRQGLEAAAKGDVAGAERLWKEALAAKGTDGGDSRHLTEDLDATIERDTARWRLDGGDDKEAAAAVTRAAGKLGRWAD